MAHQALQQRGGFAISAAHPHEVVGRSLWDTFPGARETPLGQLFLVAMANRQPVKSETPSVVMAGRWLAYRLFPLEDGMGVVFRDITDRKRAEEQRDLLVKELHHRVNNILATVQAIAAQTFRSSDADASARETFVARLINLSQCTLRSRTRTGPVLPCATSSFRSCGPMARQIGSVAQ
jgi:hypothetical protein